MFITALYTIYINYLIRTADAGLQSSHLQFRVSLTVDAMTSTANYFLSNLFRIFLMTMMTVVRALASFQLPHHERSIVPEWNDPSHDTIYAGGNTAPKTQSSGFFRTWHQ